MTMNSTKITANTQVSTIGGKFDGFIYHNGATASVVNGGVVVKEGTFFGSNATSKEYIECSGFIKAGSLVK